MRLVILIALCGLAAARYPTGTSRSQAFNQLLQNVKYGQLNNLANQLNVDEEDLVDSDQEDIQEQLRDLLQQQQQQQQCYAGRYDQDTDEEDQDDQEDQDDLYNVYRGQTKFQYGGAQNAKQAQQQCIQKQEECAQAQQQLIQNPNNKQKANKAQQKCAHAAQKCDQAQQQSQNQNQQQGGQDQQQQGANAQQQCANAQQQCANAQQQIANSKKQQGQNTQQKQQAANAQQQCANAQQQCANAQQQYANTQQQNGAQNQQQQQQQQQAANEQQQCANAQQKCADAQQSAANSAQQGYGNQQQGNAEQKCAQAQQQCGQAQQQSAQAQNEAAQDAQQVGQNPQCVQAQKKCGQAQQKCAEAHQQCNQAQQTGNQQQCAHTQKQCAKAQQKCAQTQKPCQNQGPIGQNNKYNKYQTDYDDESDFDTTERTQWGGNPIQPNYQALQQLEQPNSQLAAKLYKQAKQERDDKNTVVSPASVQLALAAVQKGAKGNTKAQIKRAQCAGMTQQKCQEAHAALIRALKGSNNVQETQKPGKRNSGSQKAKINVPNAIVVNQRTPPKPQYTQTVQNGLGGRVKTCPFKQSPQQCRKQVNQLIAAKTNHKLKQTVPRDAVTDNTKMIVVSAAQIQAKWGQQFRQNQKTKVAKFHPLGNQQTKQCQAIESKGVFKYYEDEQVQVVGIPTQQQELTVYVIVPKDQDGLTQVEKSQIQNGQQLKQLLDNADQQQQHVKVQLPKFQAKHKLDAKKTLQQQGVQDAFDNDQADFSGINSQQQQQQETGKQLHLNKLIHQATIKINEQGITAATPNNQINNDDFEDLQDQLGKQLQQDDEEEYDSEEDKYGRLNQGTFDEDELTGQTGQTKVKANRAFAFAVKHNPSNQIVLVGRVVDGCQRPNQQNQQDGTVDGVDQD